jgi:ATP-binding cassette subfamily B protein
VINLLDTPTNIHTVDINLPVYLVRGIVESQDVTSPYKNIPAIIESLSLEIPAGNTSAIVGSIGSAKGMLVQLLLRLY